VELGVRLEADAAFAQRSIRHVLESKVQITSDAEWKAFLEKSEQPPGAAPLAEGDSSEDIRKGGTDWQEFVQELVAQGRPHAGIR
jgi:hypothetical protein